MMNYPLVSVTTKDGLRLHGILTEPDQVSKTIVIHIHGAAGNFYGNSYFEELTESVNQLGLAYLSTNNRGAGVYELEKGTIPHGVALEIFEDCLLDIEAWIEFALDKGYEEIILEGHSYGTEKIVYYMNKGKFIENIIGVTLFGFSDNVGHQFKYEKELGVSYLEEAETLMGEGKERHLLSDLTGLCGELPISAQTYVKSFSPDSENSMALPLSKGKDLNYFQNIKVPILGVISDDDQKEYTVIPIKEAVQLMESENEMAEIHIIKNTNHVFTGKETELVETVASFLRRKILK